MKSETEYESAKCKPLKAAIRSGQSMIGLLVSVFLLIGLVVFLFAPRGNDGTPQKSTLKRSIEKAEGVGGTSYLGQIQQGIDMYKSDNDGKAPASLEELKRYLKDYPPEMWVNPVDKKPYIYDPGSGTVCQQGPGCPPGDTSAAGGPMVAPAPGVAPAPAAPAPAAPPSSVGPGGIHMNIPQPGAGAADAMKDN